MKDETSISKFQQLAAAPTEVNSALFVYLLENWHWQVELKPQSYMLGSQIFEAQF